MTVRGVVTEQVSCSKVTRSDGRVTSQRQVTRLSVSAAPVSGRTLSEHAKAKPAPKHKRTRRPVALVSAATSAQAPISANSSDAP